MSTAARLAKPEPTFSMELVTPGMAEDWLTRNVSNRKISRANVNRYAAAMSRGEWMFNGETIKFDTDGMLLDGQHRLLAVRSFGYSVEFGVFRNLDRAAFKTIDTGKNRTGGDIFSTYGIKNPNAVAAAARQLFFYLQEQWNSNASKTRSVSNTQLTDLLKAHPDLVKTSVDVMRRPLYTDLVPHSTNIFAYYLMSRIDAEKAKQFFAELSSGRFGDDSDAIYVLRERLIETGREFVKPLTSVKMGWTITAWNHFYKQKPLRRLPRLFSEIPRFSPEPFKSPL